MTISNIKWEAMETIGTRVKYLREARNWTQERLAQEAGLSKSFISEMENDRRNPSAEKLLEIATVLGASLDFIMKGEGATPEGQPSPVMIPRELADAAEEQRWPYGHVVAVLSAWLSLVARRHAEGKPQMTKRGWIEFYEKVRGHLE
jgi:transcriptional regulator with XRE-family HTH domain